MDEKLERIKTLQQERKRIDGEIRALKKELDLELRTAIYGPRKPRKKKA